MRAIQFLLLTCAVGSASTLTNPYFSASDPNVIGDPLAFDTQSILVTISPLDVVTVVIDLNFENGSAPIYTAASGNQNIETYGLSVGDLFFFDPSVPTTTSCAGTSTPYSISGNFCVTVPTNSSLAYAVVLDGSVNGLATGDLYQIGPGSADVSVETADPALGATRRQYRPTQAVFAIPNSPGSTVGTSGTELVCQSGPGCPTNGAQYQVTLSFTAPTAFLSLLMNGQIGVEFAAADCGNAVLAGPFLATATPEPGTLVMFAAGIGMLGFGLSRRRRKN